MLPMSTRSSIFRHTRSKVSSVCSFGNGALRHSKNRINVRRSDSYFSAARSRSASNARRSLPNASCVSGARIVFPSCVLRYHPEDRHADIVAVARARHAGQRQHVVAGRETAGRDVDDETPARIGLVGPQVLAAENLGAADCTHGDSVPNVVVVFQIQLELDLLGSGWNLQRARWIGGTANASDGDDKRDNDGWRGLRGRSPISDRRVAIRPSGLERRLRFALALFARRLQATVVFSEANLLDGQHPNATTSSSVAIAIVSCTVRRPAGHDASRACHTDGAASTACSVVAAASSTRAANA